MIVGEGEATEVVEICDSLRCWEDYERGRVLRNVGEDLGSEPCLAALWSHQRQLGRAARFCIRAIYLKEEFQHEIGKKVDAHLLSLRSSVSTDPGPARGPVGQASREASL